MPHSIVVSICSKQKSEEPGPLPARKRYQGSHIAKVEAAAIEKELPFFVLSGRHGLIPADKPVEYYDYLLVKEEVVVLSGLIGFQLKKYGIKEIFFYTKRKPAWEPYLEALKHACARNNVHLVVRELGEDD